MLMSAIGIYSLNSNISRMAQNTKKMTTWTKGVGVNATVPFTGVTNKLFEKVLPDSLKNKRLSIGNYEIGHFSSEFTKNSGLASGVGFAKKNTLFSKEFLDNGMSEFLKKNNVSETNVGKKVEEYLTKKMDWDKHGQTLLKNVFEQDKKIYKKITTEYGDDVVKNVLKSGSKKIKKETYENLTKEFSKLMGEKVARQAGIGAATAGLANAALIAWDVFDFARIGFELTGSAISNSFEKKEEEVLNYSGNNQDFLLEKSFQNNIISREQSSMQRSVELDQILFEENMLQEKL